MTKYDFETYLIAASYYAVNIAEKFFVKEKLKYDFVYSLDLNQSGDDCSDPDFDYYPEDDGKKYENQTIKEVVELLCRDNKVPVWIDVHAKKLLKNATEITLFVAGRYTDKKEKMYYNKRGLGPFGVKSPVLPIGWVEGKRFHLGQRFYTKWDEWRWHRQMKRSDKDCSK